jgi:cytochrome P450 family 135
MPLPPGPSRSDLRQLLGWLYRPEELLLAAGRERGDIFTLHLPFGKAVLVADPGAIKAIFTGDPAVLQAGRGNQPLRPIVGAHSILLLDGPRHIRQRRLLLPAFHGDRLASYAQEMETIAADHVRGWPSGTPFEVEDQMRAITLDIILRVVFGIRDAAQLAAMRPMLGALIPRGTSRLAMIPALRRNLGPRSPWVVFEAAMAALDERIRSEITARRTAGDSGDRPDVLSLLLQARDEEGEPLSDDELRDELVTLVLAGHETTTTALAWTFDLLHHQPEALARAREEARCDQEETPYLDAVITESLRLRPPLPLVARELTAPLMVMGWELPAGTRVMPNILLTHRNPDLYPDPHAFRPERFLDGPVETYAWLPFGGGIRRCVGAAFAQLEMRIVLRTALATLDTRAASTTPETIRRRAIVLSPSEGGRTVAEPVA